MWNCPTCNASVPSECGCNRLGGYPTTPPPATPKDAGEAELEALAWRIYCQFAWHGDESNNEELRHNFLHSLRLGDTQARSAIGAAKMVTAAMEQRIKDANAEREADKAWIKKAAFHLRYMSHLQGASQHTRIFIKEFTDGK